MDNNLAASAAYATGTATGIALLTTEVEEKSKMQCYGSLH